MASVVDYLVVDRKRVVAMDSASILVLSELCTRTADADKRLFYTDCDHLYRFRRHLRKHLDKVQKPGWLQFEDTDHAVEWCENKLIAEADAGEDADVSAVDLRQQYLCSGMTDEELEALGQAGHERRFTAGTQVFGAGDRADCMYFVFSGEVEVSVDTDSGHRIRVTTLGPGMVFGEIALLNRKRRSAHVATTLDTVGLEIRFDVLQDAIRTKMLLNMASYFARKIEHDTELVQHLG